ncbi:MAG: type II toxin-antitoxin system RelE/ParE family toxin [Patescibacteria group bacterium]
MEVIYWNEKVEKFINYLDRITSSRVKNTIYLLEEHGHLLDMPDSKSLGKGLFELRTQGKIKVRILYIFHKNKAYLVHGFVKKASKIGTKDIVYARRIQKEVIDLA